MAVRININPARVEAKIESILDKGRAQLTEEILNDCNQYCKEDTGTLIASSLIHSRPQDGLIIWKTPYARRQYYEIRTAHKDVNPNATWKWAERAKAAHRKEWERKAQRIMEMIRA